MSLSTYDMTHINYKNIRERMSKTNKGFWKVQSIHKLATKLKMRYNPKDYIILKTIQKSAPKIPPFILFRHEEKNAKKQKKFENQKNNSCGRLTVQNFFITGNEKNIKDIKEKAEKTKILFNKVYGNFDYEPYLYNEFQFLYLQKEKRLLPRKFKDVVKDCIALREYKNYINKLKKTKDENNMIQNEEIHTNNKKSMTVICKRNLSDTEILNNVFGENKNEDSIMSDNNIKNLNNSNFMKDIDYSSMKNIRKNNNKIIKSQTEKIKNRISLPQLNIKKNLNYKMKA